MSLSISSNDPTSRASFPTDDDKKTGGQPQQRAHGEFDFAGKAYAVAHLPTGLIAASTKPTLATVRDDARDLKAKMDAVLSDLKSPELQEYAKSGAKLYAAFVKLNLTCGEVAYGAYELAHGELLGLKELAEAKDVPFEAKELYEAHREFAHANGPKTNEAFAKLVHDLAAATQSMAKLMSDAKQLGGV